MAKTKKDEAVVSNIDDLILHIEKGFGKGLINFAGNKGTFQNISRIPTGSFALDQAMGGGYPRGRIIEIHGMESTGKTTLALCAIREAQKLGLKCAFVDAEHALDPEYMESLNIDMNELLVSQPDYGEQSLNIVETLAKSKQVDFIVIDSVAALTPKAELDGTIGDQFMGLQARMMGQALRKINPISEKNNVTLLFINQIRASMNMYGPSKVTPGGNALKFYTSQRFEIKKVDVVEKAGEPIGITSRIKIIKSKVGGAYKTVDIEILFGKGINWARDIIELAVQREIIEKSGAWYSYNGEKIGQGLSNSCVFLEENPEIAEEITNKIIG